MKYEINLMGFQRFDEGTQDTILIMVKIVRLYYLNHSMILEEYPDRQTILQH